ncbi:MAG: hypothetical protein V1716_05265 [Candidatus Uhrbacteria bacterium]
MDQPLGTVSVWPILITFGLVFLFFVALIVLVSVWYFRHFRKNKIAKIIGIIIFSTPVILIGARFLLASFRFEKKVEVLSAQCDSNSIILPIPIFAGTVTVKNLSTNKEEKLLLPMTGYEDSKMPVKDSAGQSIETWSGAYFCAGGEVWEKEIKNQPMNVVVNGYGRILEWQKTTE